MSPRMPSGAAPRDTRIFVPWARAVARLMIVPLALMAFAAPSPGHIKSCSDDNAGPEASEHCEQLKTLQCQRANFRDFTTVLPDGSREDRTGTPEAMAALSACVAPVRGQCAEAVWPIGPTGAACRPTQSQVDLCYEALLVNPDDQAQDNPLECQFCPGGM